MGRRNNTPLLVPVEGIVPLHSVKTIMEGEGTFARGSRKCPGSSENRQNHSFKAIGTTKDFVAPKLVYQVE